MRKSSINQPAKYLKEANRLKPIMDQKGITISDIHKATGVARTTVYRFFETGNTMMETYITLKNFIENSPNN